METRIERQPALAIESPRPGDEEAIGKVHLQAWHETYRDDANQITEDAINDMIGFVDTPEGNTYRANVFAEAEAHPEAVLYRVVRKGGMVVGFMHATQDEVYNVLGALYLLNEVKGTGMGDRLMTEFLAWTDKRKPSFLEVFSANERAQRFYEKYGFKKTVAPLQHFKGKFAFVEMVRPAEIAK